MRIFFFFITRGLSDKDDDGAGKKRVRLLSVDLHGTMCVFNPVELCHDDFINTRKSRLKIQQTHESTHITVLHVRMDVKQYNHSRALLSVDPTNSDLIRNFSSKRKTPFLKLLPLVRWSCLASTIDSRRLLLCRSVSERFQRTK